MKSRADPSILNYVLKVKKVEVASSEAISHALEFEGELNAYIDRRKEEERKEVERDE